MDLNQNLFALQDYFFSIFPMLLSDNQNAVPVVNCSTVVLAVGCLKRPLKYKKPPRLCSHCYCRYHIRRSEGEVLVIEASQSNDKVTQAIMTSVCITLESCENLNQLTTFLRMVKKMRGKYM